MKLFLIFALAVFSLNSFAKSKCSITFLDEGSQNIEPHQLIRNNYQRISIDDVKDGDLVDSIKDLHHAVDLSTDTYQVIAFTQVTEKAESDGRDLRLRVIKKREQYIKVKPGISFDLSQVSPEIEVKMGILRGYGLSYCEK